MSRDVIDVLSETGGAYISLMRLGVTEPHRSWLDRLLGREGTPAEQRYEEIRARKWSRIGEVADGWLMFTPVEFDLQPGMYVAVTARRYPSDPEPLATMQLSQAMPVAGRVRITPKVKLDHLKDAL